MGTLNAALTPETKHTDKLTNIVKSAENAISCLTVLLQPCSELIHRKSSLFVEARAERRRGFF